MYEENTVYVVGNSKTNTDNAITNRFNSFFIGFVVELDNDTIVDLSCSATIRTTDEFVRSLFVGKKLIEFDSNCEERVKRRYHGSSQRAIIAAYKDAVKKYNEIKLRYF
ncbi:DUF3870 domain-containing protein [Clostridium sp. MSJ-11]|uniref:DUF3870 domain-containing protein n=1 Tax=Clostridium mobile TaxID=2841512 RepID=A0ABS6EDE1_9CLOT|nr:DUF3870 domain-containing protein [Clostridium mobile]MBU5483216.1 DUF3870 domain-containing protein [Clostridium mobile]